MSKKSEMKKDLPVSENHYRLMFASAPDGTLILEAESRKIIDVNTALTKSIGYPLDDVIGNELRDIGIFNDESENQVFLQQMSENGSVTLKKLADSDEKWCRGGIDKPARQNLPLELCIHLKYDTAWE